jgi:hypothetical protein
MSGNGDLFGGDTFNQGAREPRLAVLTGNQ